MDSQQEITNYYSSIASQYDQDRFGNTYGSYIHKQEELFLAKYWNYNHVFSVDIACGTGRWSYLTQVGVDVSSNMIEEARRKHPTKEFFIAEANKLPFQNDEVEASMAFHFVMHLNQEKFKSILEEVSRVTASGGVFVFDFPSKKRRNLFNKNRKGWHASYALPIRELKQLLGNSWEIKAKRGILFFPIHRIPTPIRKYFSFVDRLLCASWLKSYSSYMVVKLKRK